MKTYRILILASAVSALFLFNCCKDETVIQQPVMDKLEFFEVISIEGLSLVEFRKSTLFLKSLDIASELALTRKDSLYEGEVVFDKIGKKKIDQTCPEEGCFSIKLEGELALVTEVRFSKLRFGNGIMKGFYSFRCSTCSFPSYRFEAKIEQR